MTTQTEQDPTLLLVSGSKNRESGNLGAADIKKLAYALIETINKHKVARLKCVGAAAVNKATKAIIVANLDEKVNGDYFTKPEFGTASFNNGEVEKTAIIFKVLPYSEMGESA